ncbi:MAG: ATP phosphoribosyltransferase regulatory subunit [Burkholderiaceae bacterium]|nr:ATP phosphoribosyltransferase regulatory subunit [Burkholderiaceae bacterium]
MPRWLLPEGVSDVLPSEARRLEELRRAMLDMYRSYGYELVQPPLVEHVQSLLTGAGSALELRTVQVVDQLSGRRIGVRADMTPQVARIDAHLLDRNGVTRLCYAGPVLHARPADHYASREPLQVGAELYGHAGLEAELEIMELMIESLRLAGVGPMRIDLSHAGIVPALLEMEQGAADALDRDELHSLLVCKDVPGLRETLADRDPAMAAALVALASLYGPALGPEGIIDRALSLLPAIDGVRAALTELRTLAASPLWQRVADVEVAVDLADLSGYHYYSGVSFATYARDAANAAAWRGALARGGRYDGVGAAFGRARPAAGFSLELRSLFDFGPSPDPVGAIRAPWADDSGLRAEIAALRAAGEIVLQVLPGHEDEQQEFACTRELQRHDGRWHLVPLNIHRSDASDG